MPHTYTDIPAAGETISVKISAVATLIPGVTKIDWSGFSRAERNPKPLSIARVVKKRGLVNYGELKIDGEYDPNDTTHIYLRDAVTGQALTAALDEFVITHPDGLTTPAKATIQGYVKEFSINSNEVENGIQTFSMTIPVDSAVFTAGGP